MVRMPEPHPKECSAYVYGFLGYRMTLPNFLIVGAQKTGTTSVFRYLSDHPDITFSHVKEPKFFNSEVWPANRNPLQKGIFYPPCVTSIAEYEKLFSSCKGTKRIGEATVTYLYHHKVAIPQIKKTLGDPPIIIMLRNPIDRAFSAYRHAVRHGERLGFRNAVDVCEERIKQNYPPMFHYVPIGMYYDQVQAYLDNFSAVRVLLLDDLKSDGPACVKALLGFLGVDDTFVPPSLGRAYNKTRTARSLRQRLSIFLQRATGRAQIDSSVSPETRSWLAERFVQANGRLGDLIGRDLSTWK